MTVEEKIASFFHLDEEAWERHANPMSVWTRNICLPLLIIALWSRIWLGLWFIIPVIIALLWTFINPRLFQKPVSYDNWASKSVLGERIWLRRKELPIPVHHKNVPNILSTIAAVGFLLVIYGVWFLEVWPALFGCSLVYRGKLWFLDRMVWLYEDLKKHSF